MSPCATTATRALSTTRSARSPPRAAVTTTSRAPTADLRIDECEYRPLTREKARAQGFPDHHIFAGEEDDLRLQVGNAVPVPVAAWLARRVKAVLPH
ncbi:DNA cytosine methyltransferase [Streptomyces nigra]|uniref:DNA cytosine methyltransferase n=1 Tax=Streptomyces nigra TaxID=1827580 RepID=UPI00364C01E1